MPANTGQASLRMAADIKVVVTAEDVRSWDGYEDAVLSGMSNEDVLRNVAYDKLGALENQGLKVNMESATIMDDTIRWDELMHPAAENPGLDLDDVPNTMDFRERPPKESLSARKTAADSNPAVRGANDALKIAKTLSNLLNELAGMDQTSREQIAEAAGLQQLPESIDRLYALSDQMRMGGVQQMQPAYASYTGWDPDMLRTARPFVDGAESPIEEVQDPAEKFRFERERASSPHAVDAPGDK